MPVSAADRVKQLLERYDRTAPLQVVKLRFWGQINSVALHVSPSRCIEGLWGGALPVFEGEDELQAFVETLMGLWNELAQLNQDGQFVRLSPRAGLDTPEGLAAMVSRRLGELEDGFMTGFVGDMRVFDETGPQLDRQLEKLYALSELLDTLRNALRDGGDPEDVRRRFVSADHSAQRIVDGCISAARRQRRESVRRRASRG